MSLNDRIREARKAKGLTQEQLGSIIGVAKTTIAGYEKNREPTAANVGAIADELGVDVNFLFQDEMKKSSASAEAKTEESSKDERILINNYRCLNDDGKAAAQDSVEALTYMPKYKKCTDSQEMA
jgi:transcriptional regulator with XRE-family HTH domain